jgi:predicted nucleotidyltransferase
MGLVITRKTKRFKYYKIIGIFTNKIGIYMLSKAEQEILALFLRAPYEPHTVYEIAKKLGMYVSQAQTAVHNLKKKKIISVKKLGNKTSSCTLNFSTADVTVLAYASIYAKKSFLEKSLKIRLIHDELEKKLGKEVYILLLFGSYAKESATSKSDIDLCFIIQDKQEIEEFKSKVKAALSTYSYKIHLNVFTAEWFYEMMKEKDSVGREVLKASIVLRAPDLYYSMVKKYDQESGYSESNIAV